MESGYFHFSMGRAPDGWVVLFATLDNESDDEILARGLRNAEGKQADPETVRVVYIEDATVEEQAVFDNFLLVFLAKLEARRMSRLAADEISEQ